MSAKPKIEFLINDSRLELIALEIIFKHDQELWKNFEKDYPIFTVLKHWDIEAVAKLVGIIYDQRQLELRKKQYEFRSNWGKREEKWFDFLEKNLAVNFSGTKFKAHIGLSPVYPRDIVSKSFLLNYKAVPKEVWRVCAHETSHFYFYEKIMEIFSGIKPSEILKSRRFWLFSEILVSMLFSNKQAIKIIGKFPVASYICKESLVERCLPLAKQRFDGKLSVDEFLIKLVSTEVKEDELNLKYFNRSY